MLGNMDLVRKHIHAEIIPMINAVTNCQGFK